jgi:hypothetical protein
VELDPERSRAALEAAGITWKDGSETIAEIAARNGLTPQQVYLAMAAAVPSPEDREPGLPPEPPRGMGRRSIAEICESHGVEATDFLRALGEMGHEASGEDTLKSVAESAGVSPHDLYLEVRERLDGGAD